MIIRVRAKEDVVDCVTTSKQLVEWLPCGARTDDEPGIHVVNPGDAGAFVADIETVRIQDSGEVTAGDSVF